MLSIIYIIWIIKSITEHLILTMNDLYQILTNKVKEFVRQLPCDLGPQFNFLSTTPNTCLISVLSYVMVCAPPM